MEQLASAFAEVGLICAVLGRPSDSILPAISRSDIVILDWDIEGDEGASTRQLISNMCTSDERRLRMIVIYTAYSQVVQVRESVEETLHSAFNGRHTLVSDSHAIKCGPVTVFVYRKRVDKVEEGTVSERDLPARIVHDFAAEMSGIVPNTGLAAVAAIRENTFRFLGNVSRSYDPGYLWQRIRQTYPSDAEDQLVELIASEFHAILEDADVAHYASLEAVYSWLDKEPLDEYTERFTNEPGQERLRLEQIKQIAKEGVVTIKSAEWQRKYGKMGHDVAGFCDNAEASLKANREFAEWLSVKTHYGSRTPWLSLGSVLAVAEGEGHAYWLCLQPKCDSVRLRTETAQFLLLQLHEGTRKQSDLIIDQCDFEYVSIRYKPEHLKIELFRVDSSEQKVRAVSNGAGFVFEAVGRNYEWITDLRDDVAIEQAQKMGEALARVGRTRSEWQHRS